MHRFFVDPDAWSADGCVLAGEEAHHLANVLRLRPGAKILLFDGRGGQWEGEVKSIGGGKVDVAVTGRRDYVPVPLSVNLLQGLPKGPKLDLIIQKAAELGAAQVIVVDCERSVVQLDGEKANKRLARWERIAKEASKQCGRPVPLAVRGVCSLSQALTMVGSGGLNLVPWEEEGGRGLYEALSEQPVPPQTVNIFIGPEGGLTAGEIAQLREGGFLSVSLGPRILRTETAGIAAMSMVLYQWGDLGRAPGKDRVDG
ncbi:MAG: 16S rRNA (uracil(1498)-N(3))-methyltransferase [Limnochordia bacterium]|jgi:16S rRNA (uracil1498-N3)-methyltransferase|nr:16S rRNA (uracil(1498)-N(3))-methyltransferase [Bacillota bacterium]